MNGTRNHVRPIKAQVQQEHRELGQMLRTIEAVLAGWAETNPAPATQDSAAQLNALRAHLAQHFIQEETEGFLDEAAAAVPRLAEAVARIKREHLGMLARLDRLIDHATLAATTEARAYVCQAFGHLGHELRQHEIAENQLLQAGFNEDFDVDA